MTHVNPSQLPTEFELASVHAQLAELCDRVLVLDRGRQVAEFQGVALSEEALLRASLDASTERVGA